LQVEHREPVEGNSECELQLGLSSWSSDDRSIKFAWRDKNGRVARGGEVPVDALGQMVVFALREGYLDPDAVVDAVRCLAEMTPKSSA
jgi:hypothetical protein